MLRQRVLAAASSGLPTGKPNPSVQVGAGAWEAFKSKFKSKFMIGDQYEHYIPPRPEFQNRASAYADQNEITYRTPAPGSQPEAIVPRGYPETEFDISLAKRASLKLTPSGGVNTPAIEADLEKLPLQSATYKFLPRHVPQPSWMYNRAALKRIRRFYLETGLTLPGVPTFGMQSTYYPLEAHQIRDDWEQVEVIRDIRHPRL